MSSRLHAMSPWIGVPGVWPGLLGFTLQSIMFDVLHCIDMGRGLSDGSDRSDSSTRFRAPRNIALWCGQPRAMPRFKVHAARACNSAGMQLSNVARIAM